MGLYLIVGMVVYLRFMVLRHHSWYHYFFTCRAQAASILALCFLLLEFVEKRREDPRKSSENGSIDSGTGAFLPHRDDSREKLCREL